MTKLAYAMPFCDERCQCITPSLSLVIDTDLLKKNICNIFYFDCSTLEDGSERLLRNVGNYQSTLRNIPEGRI